MRASALCLSLLPVRTLEAQVDPYPILFFLHLSASEVMSGYSSESDLTELEDDEDFSLTQAKPRKGEKAFEIRGALPAPRTVSYTTQALYGMSQFPLYAVYLICVIFRHDILARCRSECRIPARYAQRNHAHAP